MNNSNAECCGKHTICLYAPLKCKQWIYVFTSNAQYVLHFLFPIDKNNPEGRIDRSDTSIATMIERGLINTNLLVEI